MLAGNRVQLLQDGPSTYRAMLAAIALARDHIHLETYILDDDEVAAVLSYVRNAWGNHAAAVRPLDVQRWRGSVRP